MESNETIFKKLFYTGIGMAAVTYESLESTIQGIVNQKKTTVEDSRKILDKFVGSFNQSKEEVECKFKNLIESANSKLNLATKSDVEKLNKRLDNLTELIEKMR